MNCKVCNKELDPKGYTAKQWQYKKDMFRKQGYVYCSKICSEQVMQKLRSETMSMTNKTHASERMKINNPTFKAEVREKISKSRKGKPFPTKRYGNGTGMTEPQKLLMDLLSSLNPIAEYPVVTGKPRSSEYPQSYKPDVALLQYKIAIDIDGKSHHLHTRKFEDKKKDDLLILLGWKVIRFWNEEIINTPEICLNKIAELINQKAVANESA